MHEKKMLHFPQDTGHQVAPSLPLAEPSRESRSGEMKPDLGSSHSELPLAGWTPRPHTTRLSAVDTGIRGSPGCPLKSPGPSTPASLGHHIAADRTEVLAVPRREALRCENCLSALWLCGTHGAKPWSHFGRRQEVEDIQGGFYTYI